MKTGAIEAMMHHAARLRTRMFTLLLAGQFAEFGRGSRIVPPLSFHGLNNISVGEGVFINLDNWLNVVPGHGDEASVKIIIKSRASIGRRSQITAALRIVIEKYVIVGSNCLISDHFHASNDLSVPIIAQGIDNIKPVYIGEGTQLGNNVSVQPGVTIGRHCVIGTNSIVSHSIPDFSIAVGMPARVVKTLTKHQIHEQF